MVKQIQPIPCVKSIRFQRGTFMLETTLVLTPLLFAAGLIIELARIHQIKSIARLALYETGKSASVTHAKPEIYENVFKQHMLTLYVPKGSHASAQHRQSVEMNRQLEQTGVPVWKLEVLSPTQASFRDFSDSKLSRANRQATIRNDYQKEQHRQGLSRGWQAGLGPVSGQTIFQANTLKLRLTYLHQPFLPGLQSALRLLGAMSSGEKNQAWRKGLFAIVITHEVMMQSDLKNWWS